MAKPTSTIQPLPPDEEEARNRNVMFTVTVGTPWDLGKHLSFSEAIPRADFVLSGFGVLAGALWRAGIQIESAIRANLIPEHATVTEHDQQGSPNP